MSDVDLRYLSALPVLEWLDLDDTQITDAGLDYLVALSSLRDLWLKRTHVTEQGVAALQHALPNCKITAGPW